MSRRRYVSCKYRVVKFTPVQPHIILMGVVCLFIILLCWSRVDEGYDVKRISGHLDFINVMTYDLHGDWDNFADHHAPLHAREHDSWEFQSLNTVLGARQIKYNVKEHVN